MFLSEFYQWLQANPNIPDEIYPERIDTSQNGPAITYSLESNAIDYDANSAGINNAILGVAVWGKDQEEVWNVADALINELHSISYQEIVPGGVRVDWARVGDQGTDYDGETELFLYALQVNFSYC